MGFQVALGVKIPAMQEVIRDMSLMPGLGRSFG